MSETGSTFELLKSKDNLNLQQTNCGTIDDRSPLANGVNTLGAGLDVRRDKGFVMIKVGFFPGLKRRAANKARKGVTAIEFALIAPALFFFLIGITEISLLMLTEHLLENATYNASRTAKTGYIQEGKTQLETVMDVLLTRLSGLDPLLDPTKITVTSTAYGSLSDIGQPEQGEESLGTPSQIVVYTVTYPWKFFTPLIGDIMGDQNGVINLTSRIVVRNEPYD